MTSIPQEPPGFARQGSTWSLRLAIQDAWASLAIIVIWLAVLFDAIWGPEIVSTNSPTQSTTVPSAVALAFFAFLATWVVAKYGFRRQSKE